MASPRKRTGKGEYRVPVVHCIFTLPVHAKEFLGHLKERLGKSQQAMFGEALDMYLRSHGMPPLDVRSIRDEPEL